MTLHRLAYTALLPALSATLVSAPAQRGTDARPTISVETRLVMLPVTVSDRHGEFVAGLTREQFTVFDNGEPQTIQFFTSEDMPSTVGLVIDCSSSMRARRADVTSAATAFAASAHALDEMFTINFNEAVWPGLPDGVLFANSVEQLHHAVARAPAAGMTALFDGIDRALDHLELGTRDRRALIVVSDGGDNASSRTLDAVLGRSRRSSVAIYTILLTDPDSHDARPGVLRKLARDTGGAFIAPRRAGDLSQAFARIGQEIRSGYMLGFSPRSDAAGGFRTLRVVADGGSDRPLTVRTRAGYYAERNGGGS